VGAHGAYAAVWEVITVEPSSEVYRAIRSLRVVRNYLPEPLRDEHRLAILEAARWTGSSKNRQDWVFVVVRDRERLDRLAGCGDFTTPLRRAPEAIVPVGLPGSYEWDLGRASQNIMLAAAALGVGSCPVTMHRESCAREVLGVPDDHRSRYAIALGYPDHAAERRARERSPLHGRKPLDEVVRWETFS